MASCGVSAKLEIYTVQCGVLVKLEQYTVQCGVLAKLERYIFHYIHSYKWGDMWRVVVY